MAGFHYTTMIKYGLIFNPKTNKYYTTATEPSCFQILLTLYSMYTCKYKNIQML